MRIRASLEAIKSSPSLEAVPDDQNKFLDNQFCEMYNKIIKIFRFMSYVPNFYKRYFASQKKVLALLSILVIFYVFQFKYLEKSIFNIQFVDEDDNFVTGAWILKGQKLYKDMFFQHQPSATYISAAIQKVTQPNSFFLLVKRHRELIYFYSAIAFFLLTLRFGFVGFLTALLYETTKFYLLGNLFLAETLAIPPFLFIIGLIYESIQKKKKLSSKFNLGIALISAIFIQISLLPLTPFAIVSLVIIWYLSTKPLRSFLLKFVVIYILFFSFIIIKYFSATDYLKDTVFITSTQNIPSEVGNLGTFIARFFFYPIFAFNFQNSGFYLVFKVLSIIFVISLIFLVRRKNYIIVLLSILFFLLTNLRPSHFGLFTSGFHLLPMYGVLLWLAVLNVNIIISGTKAKIFKMLILCILLGPLILFSLLSYRKEVTTSFNREDSLYINYSPKFDYGEAVRLLSKPDDQLLVGSSDSLIYWQSQLLPSSPFFYTYDFMYKSDPIRQEVSADFSNNLPKFFYFNGDFEKDPIYGSQIANYSNVRLRGKSSHLYVLKRQLKNITDDKWTEVKRLGFTKEE